MRLGSGYSKYMNQKTYVGAECFDSKAEARQWQGLLLLERGGAIGVLQRQVAFNLSTPQKKSGLRSVKYIADFVYFDKKRGVWVVLDVKGFATKDFKIKRAWMLEKFKCFLFVTHYPAEGKTEEHAGYGGVNLFEGSLFLSKALDKLQKITYNYSDFKKSNL